MITIDLMSLIALKLWFIGARAVEWRVSLMRAIIINGLDLLNDQ